MGTCEVKAALPQQRNKLSNFDLDYWHRYIEIRKKPKFKESGATELLQILILQNNVLHWYSGPDNNTVWVGENFKIPELCDRETIFLIFL